MNIEQRLDHVADTYRSQGYKVVVLPGPDDLPDFAKDFKVEVIAKREDGCVLATAKRQSDLKADREISRYAEVISKQPNWRFDVIVLESDSQPMPDIGKAKEPSDEDIRQAFGDVERMIQADFVQHALIAAWAVLETAMRRRLQATGEEAGWGSSPRTMLNELYSGGVLKSIDFRELEGLFQARSAIVHGFTISGIDNSAVRFLIETARMLLDESRAAKKIA